MRRIPNYLDDPAQMLFWEVDEFLILCVFFGLGIAAGQLSLMVLASLVLVRVYRKVRDRRANGFLIHLVYWHTGLGAKAENPGSLVLPFIRRIF
jgi:conjugal transfer pilus assembly protein TraL